MNGVYQIRNTVNDKVYVGETCSLSARWLKHRSSLRAGTHHCESLQTAWDEFGESTFVVEGLEDMGVHARGASRRLREKYYQSKFPSIYNEPTKGIPGQRIFTDVDYEGAFNLKVAERELILIASERCGGFRSAMADELDISVRHLQRLLISHTLAEVI